jgi:PAS domain S-box-containing protein
VSTYLDIAGAPARVLIVDDDRTNRALLQVLLRPDGYILSTANTGEYALAAIARQHPDLILVDVMMPGMSGYELTTRLKSDPATRSIPVIMITALDDHDARMNGLTAGAEEFLSKPVDRAELCVRVRNLLRLKAFSDAHDRHRQTLEREVAARTTELREEADRAQRYAEALQSAEDRTRFALKNASVGTWEMDYGAGIVHWSEILEKQHGLAPGTFAGTVMAFIDCIHPDDRVGVRETMERAARSGDDFSLEYRAVCADGTQRWLCGTGRFHLRDDDHTVRGLGISQDVTARRALEAQYRQAQKMDAIGQLASGVAHDFNNLLSVILGFAELMSLEVGGTDQHSVELSEIIKAARRAAALTKHLLAFSRQQVFHSAPLDVNALITEMTGMLGMLIGNGIKVVLDLAPTISPAVADRSQLEQVIMNLVVNARDAMPDGGILTIETTDVDLESSVIHGETIMKGQYLMIAITDSGHGMSDDVQRRLFEPFFTTKEQGKGTGLGLSTAYGIVKQSKGHIWVSSEVGLGTTFKVYLPRSRSVVGAPSVAPAAPPPAVRAYETVLLVEDEDSVRRLARRILAAAGYQVLEASNGDEAEQSFAQHADSIDLVITDIMMPGCTGIELLNRLWTRVPTLKAVYMSGNGARADLTGKDAPRDLPFVQKPFTAAELQQKVRFALDR